MRAFLWLLGLRARNVDRARALFAVCDLELEHVADFEFVEHNTLELLGVEEKVLLAVVAGDKTESTIRESLDRSCHDVIFNCLETSTTLLPTLR